jgi:hypothetical protein
VSTQLVDSVVDLLAQLVAAERCQQEGQSGSHEKPRSEEGEVTQQVAASTALLEKSQRSLEIVQM